MPDDCSANNKLWDTTTMQTSVHADRDRSCYADQIESLCRLCEDKKIEATMKMSHSVQAENQPTTDNKHYDGVVDLHDINNDQSYSSCSPFSSVELDYGLYNYSTVWVHTLKEQEHKSFQKYSVFDTSNDELSYDSYVIKKKQERSEYLRSQSCCDNGQVLNIGTLFIFGYDYSKTIHNRFSIEDIISLWLKYCKDRGPIILKLRKMSGKNSQRCWLKNLFAGIYMKNIHEIIRFLPWMDPIMTHFRELKVPPSVIFDIDSKGQANTDEDEHKKLTVVPDDQAALVEVGKCIEGREEQEEKAEENKLPHPEEVVDPHLKLYDDFNAESLTTYQPPACQENGDDVERCLADVMDDIGKDQDIHDSSSEEEYATEIISTCKTGQEDVFQTHDDSDEDALLSSNEVPDHAIGTDKQTLKTDGYYEGECAKGTKRQTLPTNDLLQTDGDDDNYSVLDVPESCQELLNENSEDGNHGGADVVEDMGKDQDIHDSSTEEEYATEIIISCDKKTGQEDVFQTHDDSDTNEHVLLSGYEEPDLARGTDKYTLKTDDLLQTTTRDDPHSLPLVERLDFIKNHEAFLKEATLKDAMQRWFGTRSSLGSVQSNNLWESLKKDLQENPKKDLQEYSKKDFLGTVLQVPDVISPPKQIIEVYRSLFEPRGHEYEIKRLISFGECPEQNWYHYPAVPLAENGFYYEHDSSVICYFCKSKSPTWQRDWNPKRKHKSRCSFLDGDECGNIPIEQSRENGKYQPAVEVAFAELQLPDLHNKIQVLQRNATRSFESFKNPQLPEMGALTIQGSHQGQQEHDAMEDEPQPSTSNSTAAQQQKEGAGGLRYFVHSYDERGRPISTSQKMEFNSKEEKANTSMKKETDRLKSFANVWKKGDVISPEELAKSGFYYAGTGDRVRCAFCNGVLRNWAVGDHAAAEHRRHYPTCPFVLNLDVGNIPYSPDLSGLHTSTAATTNHAEQKKPAVRTPAQQSAQSSVPSFGAAITPSAVPGTILIPKHSNFSTVESRMLTYDNWPTSNVQRPKQLAEAGFFYTGASDNVRCFHCDGGLRNWLDSDMPWVEHAKWFPRCGFLQRAKGVEFVLEETRKHNQQNFTTAVAQNRGSTGMTTTPAPTQGVGIVERPSTGGVRRVEAREVRARFDTDRVKMVLDMGYKEAVVKYVILQRLRYTGDDFPSTQEMLESVLAEEQNLEEKGISYYENILQQEFGRPMTIVYPQVPQMTGPAGTLDKTAVPSPAPPMTQTTSASLQIPGDEKSLVEENRQLKEQTTCKICMDNEVSMVFVPCGHLVACADCAPNLRQCPICRRAITGTIRTFLS